MLVVGLTGGIATGKSTVSALFKAHNVPLVDADVLAREVVAPGTRGLRRIVSAFGPDILLPDGSLDRKKLGSIIFGDAIKRKRLNGIVHPAVRRGMLFAVLKHWLRGERLCVLDVPLLIEGGLWKLVGKVVVVYCDAETQLKRLMERDGSTREAAQERLDAQLPIAEKLPYADYVLDNSGSRSELEDQVQDLLRKLRRNAGWFWRISWLVPPIGFMSALATLAWRAAASRRRMKTRAENKRS